MATVKTKWRPSTIEGKAGTIYYQVIHHRVVRQIRTNCKLFADEWSEPQAAVVRGFREGRAAAVEEVREHIAWDLKHLQALIDRFDRRGTPYSADELVAAFDSPLHEQSFFRFMEGVIAGLKQLNRARTAENYATTLRSFVQFRMNEDLLLGEIRSDVMRHYEAYLLLRGVTKNTISFYMRILRAVYNRAVEQELTEQRHPFRHVYTGIGKTVKRAIPVAAVRRIKELDLSQQPMADFARDMFLFSFYTRGMSFIDMAYLKRTDLKNGLLSYRRRKTGQRLSIKWECCMQAIVSKYRQGGCFRHTPAASPYLLPILRQPDGDLTGQYRSALQQINHALKHIAKLVRLDLPLTMYVARHSWASIARSKNISVSVISEGMGHDSERTTQIYLASLDTARIDRANSRILQDL